MKKLSNTIRETSEPYDHTSDGNDVETVPQMKKNEKTRKSEGSINTMETNGIKSTETNQKEVQQQTEQITTVDSYNVTFSCLCYYKCVYFAA